VALNRFVDNQAATRAINDVFWCFFIVAMVAIWFAKPPFVSSGQAG